MSRFLSALVAVLAIILASASPAAAITNGTRDEGQHPYVGAAFGTDAKGNVSGCSGTLISPTVFLTAGHCTAQWSGTAYVTFKEEAIFDTKMNLPGTPVTYPGNYDVGVIVLAEPYYDVGFGTLAGEGRADGLANGTTPLTAVGYGARDFIRGGGPPMATDFWARFYANVTFINENSFGYTYLKISSNAGQGQGGTCFGDSGGPILTEDQAILGVISGGRGNCNAVAYAQRVDLPEVQSWVNSFVV